MKLVPEKSFAITSFLNISQVWNFGVSFGMFKAAGNIGVISLFILALLIIAFLSFLLIKSKTKLEVIALSCVIGGALGNLFDRVYYGAVYDFIDFHYMKIHFWTFNLADAYITLGAILLVCEHIINSLISSSKDK